MFASLVPQGFVLIASCLLSLRWLDSATLATICLCATLCELVTAVAVYSTVTNVGSTIIVNAGYVDGLWLRIGAVFVGDALSGVFLCVLLTALVLCFIFLVTYFDVDSSATSIVL